MTERNDEIVDEIPEPVELPGEDVEQTELVDEAEDALLPQESDVTLEDMSVSDLIDDGVDPMDMATTGGVMESVQGVDDRHDETIDARVQQEEYEPGSAIVPPPRGVTPEL